MWVALLTWEDNVWLEELMFLIDDVSSMSYSLSNLLSVLEHLESSWARAFLRGTRFLDPDFQGDVLAVICTWSTSRIMSIHLNLCLKCTSYDLFLFANGYSSSPNHTLSSPGSIPTPISWPQRHPQRGWRRLRTSTIHDFRYPQEWTISVSENLFFFFFFLRFFSSFFFLLTWS